MVGYCPNCKKRVRGKRVGTGYWLFVVLIWFPSLLGVLILFAGASFFTLFLHSVNGNNGGLVLILLLLIWILSPAWLYFSKKPSCPICGTILVKNKNFIISSKSYDEESVNIDENIKLKKEPDTEMEKEYFGDPFEQIEKLGKLRDSKLISEEEFQEKRKKYLSQI